MVVVKALLVILTLVFSLALVYLCTVSMTRYVFIPIQYQSLQKHNPRSDKELTPISSAVFYGMVRDGMPGIKNTVQNMIHLSAFFVRAEFCIMEDGSTDGTREYLDSIASNNKKFHIVDGKPETKYYEKSCKNRGPGRIHKYASLRNQQHKIIVDKFGDLDFCVLMDMDNVSAINLMQFQNAVDKLQQDSTIDAISGYNRTCSVFKHPFKTILYDTYAYEDDHVHQNNMVHDPESKKSSYIWSSPKPIFEHFPKVISNFGGCCIYRNSEKFKNNYYAVEDIQDDKCLCEHVGFNRRLDSVHIGFDSFFYNE